EAEAGKQFDHQAHRLLRSERQAHSVRGRRSGECGSWEAPAVGESLDGRRQPHPRMLRGEQHALSCNAVEVVVDRTRHLVGPLLFPIEVDANGHDLVHSRHIDARLLSLFTARHSGVTWHPRVTWTTWNSRSAREARRARYARLSSSRTWRRRRRWRRWWRRGALERTRRLIGVAAWRLPRIAWRSWIARSAGNTRGARHAGTARDSRCAGISRATG